MNRRWNSAALAETLEQRTVPAAVANFNAGVLTITGTAASEAITVRAGASYTDVLFAGRFTARLNGATSNSISTINVTGGGGTDSLAVSGINLGLTVGLTDVAKLSLNSPDTIVTSNTGVSFGVSNVTGTLNVTAAGAITQFGRLSVIGETTLTATGGNNITLSTSGNSFGTLALSAANVTLKETGATDLGTISTGDLTVTSSGAITDSGNLLITGNTTLTSSSSITLDQLASSFGGSTKSIALKGTSIAITDTNATGTVLDTTKATGTLNVTTAGDVTQIGGVTATGLATIAAGAGTKQILLNSATLTNNFGSLSLNGTTVSITERSSTDLATTTATTLTVTANSTITDSDKLTVTGVTSLTSTGGSITLDEIDSTFASTLTLKGANISVLDSDGATELGSGSKATGTFALTTTGTTGVAANDKVTQAAAITSLGRLTITATGKDITLNTVGNKFGAISVFGKNVDLREVDASDLFISEVTGTLKLISGGGVTDSGDVSVTGTTEISTAATNKSIILDVPTSDFAGAVTLSAPKNIAITNVLATNLATVTATTGTLSVTSGGDVIDSGVLTVGNRATITAVGRDITLNSANNYGSIAFTGHNVLLTESSATDIYNSTTTHDGTFTLTSTGAITDSGKLTIDGNMTLVAETSANAADQNITLDSADSTFGGNILLRGANVSVRDSDPLGVSLGTTTVSGQLTIISAGDITDSAATTVSAGSATFTAGTPGDITLTKTTLTGATKSLRVTGDDATLTIGSAVQLDSSTLTGDFYLHTSGAITTSDNLGTDLTADDVTLITDSGAIGTTTNFLRLAANTVTATTNDNSGINLVELDTVTVASAGLNAGTGTITFGGGTFTLGGSNRINDTADVNVTGGATFDLGANNETIDQLILTNGSVTGSGTLTATSDFDVRSGSISTILAGSVGLTKTTTSTATLSGANTYTGATTISAGTLSVTGSLSDSTDVSVASGAIYNVAASDTIDGLSGAGSVTLGANTLTVGGNNQATATFSGVISGTGGFTKIGTGTQTLSGTNTYSGVTTINAGTLALGSASALGTTAGGTTVASGAVLDLNGQTIGAEAVTLNGTGIASGGALINSSGTAASLSGNITLGTDSSIGGSGNFTLSGVIADGSGPTALEKVGTGTVTLSGASTYTGATTISNGTLSVTGSLSNSTDVSVASGAIYNVAASDTIDGLSGAGSVTLGANTLTVGGNNETATFSGGISGTGGLTKTGTGTQTLSGTNTYTGATTINNGTLTASGGSAIADGSTVVFANTNGAILSLSSSETIGSLAGGGNSGGDVTLNANTLTIGADNTTSSYDGVVSGTGGLTKTGTGTQTLSRASTYTGATTISNGTLSVTGSLSNSTDVSVASGAIYNVGASDTIDGLSGAGSVTLGANTLTVGGNNEATATFSGGIGGTGGLTKTGTGTQTFSGTNTYTGATTVSAGTLNVNGLLTSNVTVASGGTLGGTGTTAAITTQSGGTVAPGTSPGILNSGNVVLVSGSTFAVEIGGTTAGNAITNHDQLNVTGTVNLGNATLSTAAFSSFSPAIGNFFIIILNDGSDLMTTTFASSIILNFLGSGFNATISYIGGDGNDVVIIVGP